MARAPQKQGFVSEVTAITVLRRRWKYRHNFRMLMGPTRREHNIVDR